MKAIIMAGGEGSRLRPLTCTVPKPMLPVMDKPVMEHIVELLKKHKIKDIGVTLMYLPREITDYFADGQEFGVNLSYYTEDTPLGTAGSVKNAEEMLDSTFIVISGDALTDINLTEAVEFHRKSKARATLVLTKCANPSEYGTVVTDKDGRIVRFIEKPSKSEVFSDSINTGIYILEPEVLNYITPDTQTDFAKDVFPEMLECGDALFGYVASGYWCDIGDLDAYRQCHFDILDGKVGVSFPPSAQIPNATAPYYVSNSAKISGTVGAYSVIGSGCVLSKGASTKHSVVHHGTRIGAFSEIRGAILSSGVKVGERCIVTENCVIGALSEIGDLSAVKNAIKIWPQKHIERESEIAHNLVWGTGSKRGLFDGGTDGEINTVITPEFASRAGAAFSAHLGGGKIALGFSAGADIAMVKNAFSSGLLSSGAYVFELGILNLASLRRAVTFYGLDGGVYISRAENGSSLFISLVSADGCDISRGEERKIEMLFSREDFIRSEPEDIKNITYINDFYVYYLREIVNLIQHKKNTPVYMKNTNDALSYALVQTGALLYGNPQKGIMQIETDYLGEKLILHDENQKLVSDEKLMYIMTEIAIEMGEKKIALPTSAPEVISKNAQKRGVEVIEAKNGRADIMRTMKETSKIQFRLNFDAPYFAVMLINYLNDKNLTLCSLTEKIPDIYVKQREFACRDTGKTMRTLTENLQKEGISHSLSDGVKIIRKNGWVLIIPHSKRPSFKIISEGTSEEFATELCDFAEEKLREI